MAANSRQTSGFLQAVLLFPTVKALELSLHRSGFYMACAWNPVSSVCQDSSPRIGEGLCQLLKVAGDSSVSTEPCLEATWHSVSGLIRALSGLWSVS